MFFYVVAVTALSETSAAQKRSLRSAIRMSIKSQATFSTELLLGSVAEAAGISRQRAALLLKGVKAVDG